jgi:hypothetical protein
MEEPVLASVAVSGAPRRFALLTHVIERCCIGRGTGGGHRGDLSVPVKSMKRAMKQAHRRHRAAFESMMRMGHSWEYLTLVR